jgi:hypothetical protein
MGNSINSVWLGQASGRKKPPEAGASGGTAQLFNDDCGGGVRRFNRGRTIPKLPPQSTPAKRLKDELNQIFIPFAHAHRLG